MVRPSSKLFTPTSNLLFIFFFLSFFYINKWRHWGWAKYTHLFSVYTQYLFYRTAVLYSILCTMSEGWGKYIWNETPQSYFFFYHGRLAIFLSTASIYTIYYMDMIYIEENENIICGQRPENIYLSINIEHVLRYYVWKKNVWSFWQSP